MALTWSIDKVENYEELYVKDGEEFFLNPVTTALLYSTMVVEMGEITEKNYKEFYTRLMTIDAVTPPPNCYLGFVTLDSVKRHIGLKTNVITSKKAFNKRLWALYKRRIS